MQRIIDPIEKHLLVQELTPDKFLCKANKGGNEIYSFIFHDSPYSIELKRAFVQPEYQSSRFVNYDDDFRFLVQKVRQLSENLPPLLSAYVNLSSTMKAINEAFGDVDEMAILVTISDNYPDKLARYAESYQKATVNYELIND